mgnify:CR=1 FL=1
MCGLFFRIMCIPSRLRMMQLRLVLHVPFRRAGVCSAFSCRAILAKESPFPRRLLILSTPTCSSGNGTRIRRPWASLSVLFPCCSPIPIRAPHVLPPNALLPQPADSQASSPAGPFQRNPAFLGFLLLRLLPLTRNLLRIDSLPQTVHTSRRSPLSAHLACERT